VVLIEGRNRELRKMFEEIGHFVEKIRRVGYGPLILDQEPGNLRELDSQELELLRKAADGKLKTPKAKEIRRRNIVDSLPPEKPAFKARRTKRLQTQAAFGDDRPARTGAGPSRFGSRPTKFGPGRPTDSAAPRAAWRSLNQVVVPLTSAQARQGRNQPDPRQSRWKSWGPASRRACTLSRFRISDARKNQGQIGQELTGPELTVPAQAVLHPDTQDQRAQDRADPVRAVPGRFARAVAVRVPHVPSEAKAD
jgi:hypothetical protein